MDIPKVLGIMSGDRGSGFDPTVFDAAAAMAEQGEFAQLASAGDEPFDVLRAEQQLSAKRRTNGA